VIGRPQVHSPVGHEGDVQRVAISTDGHAERRRLGFLEQQGRRLRHRQSDVLDLVDRHVQPCRDAGRHVPKDLHELRRRGHINGDCGREIRHEATYTNRRLIRSPTVGGCTVDLTLDRRAHGSWAVVEVTGELDLYTAPSFRESVLEAGDGEPAKVIVDFRGLGFIDSSGLGAIVACLKHLRERGGDLALVAPEGSGLRRLMDLTGLDRVLTLYASTDEIPQD
jgi:anti-sigma B factor antagonist